MQQLRLRIHTLVPDDLSLADDEAAGNRLIRLVREALGRGDAPPVAVVVRPDRVDLIPLAPIARAEGDVRTFIAGLTRTPIDGARAPIAVGVMGRFDLRGRKQDRGVPVAIVFLEWTDCRWWHWKALLDTEDRAIRAETETVLRAIDGASRPANLGGWWTLGRRRHVRLRFQKVEPVVH